MAVKDYGYLARFDKRTATIEQVDQAIVDVNELFTYQPWNAVQVEAGGKVNEALRIAYSTILAVVPPSASRQMALQHIVDARLRANTAITFLGGA